MQDRRYINIRMSFSSVNSYGMYATLSTSTTFHLINTPIENKFEEYLIQNVACR